MQYIEYQLIFYLSSVHDVSFSSMYESFSSYVASCFFSAMQYSFSLQQATAAKSLQTELQTLNAIKIKFHCHILSDHETWPAKVESERLFAIGILCLRFSEFG